MKKLKPSVFLIGSQRSGTTLLGRMLASHSNIYMKNESPKVVSALQNKKPINDVLNCLQREMNDKKEIPFEEIMKSLGKEKWGLKDPALQYYLDDLLKNFPDSRFILIIRDGRAVGLSKIKAKFGTANIFYAAEQWKKEVENQKNFYLENPERCCLVYYEDLVLSPEKELKNICEFLEEKYEPSMLQYYKNNNYIEETNKFNINTFKKLDPAIINKWKQGLSRHQINIFETIAGDELKKNNYKITGEVISIPPLLKGYYKIHQSIISELQLQYQVRVRPFMKKINTITKNNMG